jgi:hypothetical protein
VISKYQKYNLKNYDKEDNIISYSLNLKYENETFFC